MKDYTANTDKMSKRQLRELHHTSGGATREPLNLTEDEYNEVLRQIEVLKLRHKSLKH